MKLLSRRNLLWVMAFLVLAALALAFRSRPVPVELVEASQGPLRVTLDEEGETRVRDRFVVSAPLAGRVLRIELEPGDAVRAGETVLASFLPQAPALLDARSRAESQARVRAASAALGSRRAEHQLAEAELTFARSELVRIETLASEEILSRERLEAAELEVRTREEALRAAVFAIRSAEQELEVRRAQLSPRSVDGTAEGGAILLTSPIDGVVLRRLRESEAVVAAGESLLEVGNPEELEIVADLLSVDAVQVAPGAPVWIERWGGEAALAGRVRRVEPSGFTKVSALGVEEQRVNVLIDLVGPKEGWRSLGDGYRVEVRILLWESADALRIPTSALFRHAGGWATYGLDQGRVRLVSLEIGHSNGIEAEVLSGLSAGDAVIVHPSDAVAEGVRAEARSADE